MSNKPLQKIFGGLWSMITDRQAKIAALETALREAIAVLEQYLPDGDGLLTKLRGLV